MAETLTEQTAILAAAIEDEDLLWLVHMSAAANTRDRKVSIENLREAFSISQGSIPAIQTAHGLSVGDVITINLSGAYVEATADLESNAGVVGVVVKVIDANAFRFKTSGYVSGLSGLTVGEIYYLQDAGGLGTTAGTVEVPVLLATSTTAGVMLAIGAGGGGGNGVYDLVLGFTGPISASVLDWILVGRACFIDNAAPGEAFARTLPSADWTADIQKNGTGVGTVTISSAGVVTWSIASDISLAAGDRIELVAPDPADGTIEDVQVAFRALVT